MILMKLKNWLAAHSVARKLWFLLIIQSLIFFLWVLSVVLIQTRNDIAASERKNESLVVELYSILDTEINDLQDASAFPITRDKNGLPNAVYRVLSQNSEAKLQSFEFISEFDDIANNVFYYSRNISRICIVSMSGSGIAYDRNSLWRNSSFFTTDMSQPWIQDAINEKGKASLPVLLDSSQLGYKNSENYVYCVRAIVNAEKYKVVGLAIVGMDLSEFDSLFHGRLQFNDQKILVFTEKGFISKTETTLPNSFQPSSTAKTEKLKMEGEQYSLTSFYPSEDYIGVASLTKRSSMHQGVGNFIIPIYVTIILLVVTTLLVTYTIISSIHKPLKELLAAVESYSDGDFSVRTTTFESDSDIASLQVALNTMADKIQNLIDEVYVQQLEKKEFQLRLLRSQVNPHFLYNALESARMRAMLANDKVLETILLSLSEVLRYGLVLSDDPVTLDMELDNVKSYIDICNACSKRPTVLEIQIDDMCHNAQMPRMTIQPLVENSIKHGFEHGEKPGTIRILGWAEENCYILRITDNGSGISEERLVELQKNLKISPDKGNTYSGSSIGVLNVHQRIRLTYGPEYGLQVFSVPNYGFSTEIRLPMLEVKNNG